MRTRCRTVPNQTRGGTRVDSGSTVRIEVSRGNASVKVPGVIGSTVQEADRQLRAAGFDVTIEADASSAEPQGQVIRQDPEPGTLLATGEKVTITVSTPAEKEIPDLKGQDPVAAAITCDRASSSKAESSATVGSRSRTDRQPGNG
jgi:serine/threonine-protein kinase